MPENRTESFQENASTRGGETPFRPTWFGLESRTGRWLCSLLFSCLVAATGCGDEQDSRGLPDGDRDTPEEDTAFDNGAETDLAAEPDAQADMEQEEEPSPWISSVRFDLEAALADDFFAFPYPSDLRLSDSGSPDLTSFPTYRGVGSLLAEAVALVEEGSAGFSPLSAVFFTFEVPLDPESLPQEVDETMTTDASVFLVDVTPSSPTYGQPHPVQVIYNEAGGGYWPAHTLAIQPLFGIPLRTNTTYAAIVTEAVRSLEGDPLVPPEVLARLEELLADDPGADPMAEHFRPLYQVLRELGEEGHDPVAATVFTTSEPAADLVSLRNWMVRELALPTAKDLTLVEQRAGYSIYEGTFDSVEFFTGTSPYRSFGEGLIGFDEQAEPLAATPVELAFAVTVPVGTMPESGWPMVLYGHGLGENHSGFVNMTGAGLASRGVAVLGLDPPLQGERNPTAQDDHDLIVGLAVSNIVIGREILRQGVLDEVRAAQLVQAGLTIPASVAADGQEIGFDPQRVAFMGHSEGAQIGALLAAIEPNLGAFVLSSGGGGAAITMLELDTAGIDVAEVVSLAVGIDPSVESLDLYHPVVAVVIQPLLDVADPLHFARRIFREPADGRPHDLVMTEGFLDLLTPPNSTEALASAAGLPIAEPVGRPIEACDLQGIGSVTLPAQGNLPEVGEIHPTGALLQFPELDHYVIYRSLSARTQLFEFLRSSLQGATILPAP
ncbi:MAG: hypothetical protein JW797_06660 [Bradymonadales bacterium]|nr:hypothetical protein [Bradymonadales bacterium]